MNKKIKLILMLLIVSIAISSYFIFKEIAESKQTKDVYENLQEIVKVQENSTNENANTDILNNNPSNISSQNSTNNYNLENIKKINSDVIGWIKIPGTNIDYPIMQNGNYYLKKNIYKKYSSHGTPYLAEHCSLKSSDNLIIYGHHMNDNTMFSQLEYYKNFNFYQNHKYINFYKIENGTTIEENYQIVIAFKTIAYSDKGFKYYNYTKFNTEQELSEFIENCLKLKFYDTDMKINYGDKFITLSTCEYSQKNGRMVVVAKEI